MPRGRLRPGQLGAVEVGAFTAAATTPMTVVFGVMTMAYAVTGFRGLPIAFLLIGIVLAVFCVGYVAMARDLAYAGALYTYIARGLGRPVGVGAAWVALLSYNALQVGLYGAIGNAADPVLRGFGVDAPWWVSALVAWGIVAWMGLQRVKRNARVLVLLLVAELAVLVLFSVTALIAPTGGSVALDTLDPSALTDPGLGASLAIAVLGFIGFESTAVYIEEARDPHRTVRNASYGVITSATAMYVMGAVALGVIAVAGAVVAESQAQGFDLMFTFAGTHLGSGVVNVARGLFILSLVAAMISFHNTNNRYMLALGRERILPAIFAVTRPSTATPKWASAAQSAFGLIVILVWAVAGWDPVATLFYWGGTSGAIGILLLLAATSVAILRHFVLRRGVENHRRAIIASMIASGGLLMIVVLALDKVDVLLGVAPDSPLRWGVPVAFLGLAVLGVVFALCLRRLRPVTYHNIGFARTDSGTAPE